MKKEQIIGNITEDFLFDLGFEYSEDGNLILSFHSSDCKKIFEISLYDDYFIFNFSTENNDCRIESSVSLYIYSRKQLVAFIDFCKI